MELQTIWFFLWGLLWALYFMTDGFDLGIGTLYPILGKSNADKQTMINALGPLWDGNEVWLLTAGGVTFAAFPLVYAVMFSSLYAALMLILFALIIRGVSFEFRNKIDSPAWIKVWDTCIFVGSIAPAILFGVASWFAAPLYQNYLESPILFVVILGTVAALMCIRLFLNRQSWFKTWFASALTIVGATFFGVIGLYHNLFPSSIDPAYNLSAHNASSSPLTLRIMLMVVILFMPLVLAHQIWTYFTFKDKVQQEDWMY